MHRLPLRYVALAFLLLAATAAEAQDRIDLSKNSSLKVPYVTGTIRSEDAAKVVILQTSTRAPKEVPTIDIVEVKYEAEPAEVAQARGPERLKDYNRAIGLYKDAYKKVPPDQKFLRADVQYRTAKLMALQAESSSGADRRLAIQELRSFRAAYPDARQTVDCLDLLSRLLLIEGQSRDEVVTAFRELKKRHGANSKEISTKCDLFEGQLLVEDAQGLLLKNLRPQAEEKYREAQSKLEASLGVADKVQAVDIRISLAECKAVLGKQDEAMKELDEILTNATDNRTLAAAYLGRGDCLRLNDKYREAMWDYLWVDVVYNEDREKQAKALFHLKDVFEKQNDTARAADAATRLKTDPRFKDTSFQKLLR